MWCPLQVKNGLSLQGPGRLLVSGSCPKKFGSCAKCFGRLPKLFGSSPAACRNLLAACRNFLAACRKMSFQIPETRSNSATRNTETNSVFRFRKSSRFRNLKRNFPAGCRNFWAAAGLLPKLFGRLPKLFGRLPKHFGCQPKI